MTGAAEGRERDRRLRAHRATRAQGAWAIPEEQMPKPAARTPETHPVRDHILDVASELFYSRGIRTVGVDEIIAAAEVAKATLYRHFPSKEDIIVSYLEKRRLRLQEAFVACLAREEATWRDRVLAVFDGLVKNLRTPGFRGCAFLMAVAHHGESARVRAAARSYKRFLRDRLRRVLDGEVRDSRELTEQLLLVYEGALTTAVLRPDSDPGARARRCAEVLLAQT
jgi:AcrR family transcriptional regulator